MASGAWPSCARESGSRPLSGEVHLGWTVTPGLGLLTAGAVEHLAAGWAHPALWPPGLSFLLESPLEGPALLVQAPGSLDRAPLADVLRKEGVMQERGSCSKIVSIEKASFVFIETPLQPGHPTARVP